MRLSILAVGTLGLALAVTFAPGCGGDSGGGGGDGEGGSGAGGKGMGGSSGGKGGSGMGGSGMGGSGMGGMQTTFMDVKPCSAETDYMSGSTVAFPNTGTDIGYTPKCLKVKKGAAVKFTGSFPDHPLAPSKKRGELDGNPITATMTGTEASFTFAKEGFFAYYCTYHGSQDTGSNVNQMVGVVWVTP